MIYLMITVILLVAFYVSYKKERECERYCGGIEDAKFTSKVLIVIMILIYIITFVWLVDLPTKYQSEYLRLRAQEQYVSSLPQVPISGDGQNSSGIKIDLANEQIANQVIEQTIKFFKDSQKYNSAILFWKAHPYLDLVIWGYPLVAKKIATLPLINLDTFPKSP